MAEGAVLVIGGCGFVGFHVVKALLEEETWPSVHVMSRKPARNQLAGAFYHVGDMTSADQVRTLLDEIRPSVVIHTAFLSPLETQRTGCIGTGPTLEELKTFLTAQPPAPTSKHSYILLPCQSSINCHSIILMNLRRWLRLHLSSTTMENPRPWPTSMC